MSEQIKKSTSIRRFRSTMTTSSRITNPALITQLRSRTAITTTTCATLLRVRTSNICHRTSTSVPSRLTQFSITNICTPSTAFTSRLSPKPAMILSEHHGSRLSLNRVLSTRTLRCTVDIAVAVDGSYGQLLPWAIIAQRAPCVSRLCGTTPSGALLFLIAHRIAALHHTEPCLSSSVLCHALL
jgi:hypothetical protein